MAKGETLQEWLKFKGYRKVAIYGYGVLGRTLESTLMNDGITVQCIVDKNYENISSNVLCVSPNNVPLVDAMIVSVVSEYDEIETEAILRYDFPIISIEDVIYGTGGIR